MSRTTTGTNSKNISMQATSNPQSTASAKNKSSPAKKSGNGLDREEMISVAAYFRAEHRGFDGMHQMEDWLAAEEEIDEMLKDIKEVNVH